MGDSLSNPIWNGYINARIEEDREKFIYNPSVSNMKSTDLNIGDIIATAGYYSAGDGGGGIYKIVDNEALVDDGGSVHDLTNGLKAVLCPENGEVSVLQFGAKRATTSLDSSTQLQKCIDYVTQCYLTGTSYIIVWDGGVYCLSNQVIGNYYARMKSKGLVKIWCRTTTTSTLYYQHIESLGGTYSISGFFQGHLIDGSNGGFLMVGTNKNLGQIGIEFGDLESNGLTVAQLKNAFAFVELESFAIALKINHWHNYLMHFASMGFRNSAVAVQFGDATHTTLDDSGENISFEKCTFGGCGIVFKRYAPFDWKSIDCSFDMNNCVLENFSDTAQADTILFERCWIERNGLTSFVNYGCTLGIFVNNNVTNYLKIDLLNSNLNYGGITEGVQVTDYLIRGKIRLNPRNVKTSFGTDFSRATKPRLFLCSNDVAVMNNHEFRSNAMCLSEASNDILSYMFQDLPTGAVPASGAWGNYTIISKSGFNVAQVITATPFSTGGKVIQLQPTASEGVLEFETTNFIPIQNGKTIRPLLAWVMNNCTNAGASVKVYLFDSNQVQVGTYLDVGYVFTDDFSINPGYEAAGLIPSGVCYYKLRLKAYFNVKDGEILLKGVFAYTY